VKVRDGWQIERRAAVGWPREQILNYVERARRGEDRVLGPHPLTTPQGRIIATFLPMPAPCTTSTTSRTSL
jgi:hypothetical protein